MEFALCHKCTKGKLLPLSDYGQDGSSVLYKAWACSNEKCGFSIRVDKGVVTFHQIGSDRTGR